MSSEVVQEILEITGDGMTLSFRIGATENDVVISLTHGEKLIETTVNDTNVAPDMIELVYLYAIRELKAEIRGERVVAV